MQAHGDAIDQTRFEDEGWSLASQATQNLLEKLRQNAIPLGDYVHGKIYRGILTGLNKAFVIDQPTKDRLIAEDPRSAEVIKPFAHGRDIKRYAPIEVKQFLILFHEVGPINTAKEMPGPGFQTNTPLSQIILRNMRKKLLLASTKETTGGNCALVITTLSFNYPK